MDVQLCLVYMCCMLLHFVGIRQGTLMKKLRQSDVWKSRWFVLSAEYLSYFKSYQVRIGRGDGGREGDYIVTCQWLLCV